MIYYIDINLYTITQSLIKYIYYTDENFIVDKYYDREDFLLPDSSNIGSSMVWSLLHVARVTRFFLTFPIASSRGRNLQKLNTVSSSSSFISGMGPWSFSSWYESSPRGRNVLSLSASGPVAKRGEAFSKEILFHFRRHWTEVLSFDAPHYFEKCTTVKKPRCLLDGHQSNLMTAMGCVWATSHINIMTISGGIIFSFWWKMGYEKWKVHETPDGH